jgi:uncharacterized membrane protein
MSKFIVVVFPDEAKAHEGERALKELHEDGSLTVYGTAVLTKDADGKVSTKQHVDRGPLGAAVGALLGMLIGLIGGPGGAFIGFAGGAIAGGRIDVNHWEGATDFLEDVSRELTPGKSALAAEVDEEWVTPLDSRMEAIGGVVLREQRADTEAERIEQEAEARRADLARLDAENARASQEARARLKARADEARAKLKKTTGRAEAALDCLEKETSAKIATLQEQAAKASADTKERLGQRILELRADGDRRAAKLRQASELVREALEP